MNKTVKKKWKERKHADFHELRKAPQMGYQTVYTYSTLQTEGCGGGKEKYKMPMVLAVINYRAGLKSGP